MNLRDVAREFKSVPLGLIDEPALPSRSTMDEQKLDELTTDIRAKGVLVPLNLARVGDRYQVVAGHRRWWAARRAGLSAVPAVIYPSLEAALEGVKYSENRYREELNPADEALWFSELLERDCGGDVDKLAEQLGEKRSYLEGRLLLFQGDELVFEALRKGEIKIGVASELNKCSQQTYRRYLLHQATIGGATVSVVRGWVQEWQNTQRAIEGLAPAASEPASIAPVPQTDFFRCVVCGETTDVYLMVPVNVHRHCKLAILDKLLATYHGDA